MAKIYVASSWRNQYYPDVVKKLREYGHEVYDFRNPQHDHGAFMWKDVDSEFDKWNVEQYKQGLQHPSSERQFQADLDALNWADTCLLVLPCGRSAHTEAGWMKGAGKKVIVYIPEMQEAELMYKLFDLLSDSLEEVNQHLQEVIDTHMDMINDLGEPYSGDSKFVAKCRKLQSIYRAEQGLAIRPYKARGGIHYYGNYIEGGEISGANFLSDYIFDYAKHRVEHKEKHETIEPDRLFNNLLSSQPMAFNLFCPLRKLQQESPEEATRIIRSALPMFPIDQVTKVDLEFIPSDYKDLTGDKSAMDAIICFKTADGKDGFIAIETKYSENLGTNEASNKEKSLEIIKHIKCFNPDVEEKIKNKQIKLTQIYRNFLLSESYGLWSNADSYSIVLSPKIHPSTDKEVCSIIDEMQPDYKGKLQNISLESFTDKLISESPEEYADIFRRFRERYLRFDKVE